MPLVSWPSLPFGLGGNPNLDMNHLTRLSHVWDAMLPGVGAACELFRDPCDPHVSFLAGPVPLTNALWPPPVCRLCRLLRPTPSLFEFETVPFTSRFYPSIELVPCCKFSPQLAWPTRLAGFSFVLRTVVKPLKATESDGKRHHCY